MRTIPDTWAETTLDKVCDVILGQSPPGTAYNDKGVGLPFFQGKAEFGSLYPSARKWTTEGNKRAQPDDVLISVRAPVGPTNLAPFECVIGRGLAALRPGAVTTTKFVLYQLKATENLLVSIATGSTFSAISGDQLREHGFVLAPLPEQARIVAVIEEQFSRLDEGQRSLATLRRLLLQLRTSVLATAMEGDWPLKQIEELAVTIGSGATPKKGRKDYYDGGTIPWVTSAQLVNSLVTQPTTYITEKALAETSVRLWPKHALLVAMYGEGRTRGHCSELLFESTTNQACAAIVLSDDAPIRRDFLRMYFAASYDRNRRLASGGVQPNLSLGLIRSMAVPVPSLAEQDSIVNYVEWWFSTIDELERAIAHAVRRGSLLRRSILDRAFSGLLVPQDPSDETASELLSRLGWENGIGSSRAHSRKRS